LLLESKELRKNQGTHSKGWIHGNNTKSFRLAKTGGQRTNFNRGHTSGTTMIWWGSKRGPCQIGGVGGLGGGE